MYVKLKGAKVFSTINLRSGYHHIAFGKDSRAKTAFVTPFGKYKFLLVPFGLAQAPAYFQLLMNKLLEGLLYAIDLCRLLILIYNLQKKAKKFKWTDKAEKAFNEIKKLLISRQF